MQTDATSNNIVVCCWGFLANNVASVCMGLVQTSANIVVVPCKRTQHFGPNNVASVCMGLYTHAKFVVVAKFEF